MRFIIQREQLLTPLQHVVGIVEKRQTMPILATVLIEVREDAIAFTGSNLEVELTESAQMEQFVEEGKFAVSAHKLLDIARVLSADTMIELELSGSKLQIQADRSKYSLMTLPSKDYPRIQSGRNEQSFKISQGELRKLIELVHFSIAQQDVRYFLNGLHLEVDKQQICAVASDGHRLSMCSIKLNEALPVTKSLIPRKTILELLKLLEPNDLLVSVYISESHIRIVSDTFELTSKLIDAKFPPVESIRPKAGEHQLLIDTDELKKMLSHIAILTNEKFRGIKLLLNQNKLVLMAHNAENEEASEETEVSYQGAPIEAGYNVNYFLDVLNTLPDKKITITFSEDNSSVTIQGNETPEGVYYIMPMRF